MKKIFTLAAIAALALPASADTLDILDSFGTAGYDSSYDADTKTITFDGEWKGRGWWLDGADYSQWDQVVVEFEPCSCTTQLMIEYNAEGSSPTSKAVSTGDTKIACEFDANYKNSVKQIYIQSAEAGTLTLTAAYLENGIEVDPNLLWEGEYNITGWNSGAEFAASKVAAGDVIEYTFTDPGSSSGQVLVKGSDWNNLLDSGKINYADMALGKVQMGITQDMLDACGGKIFVLGDGGAVLTKVEKVGTFDADGVLCYGSRVLGTSLFITIPEGTTELAVEYSAEPEWAQICSSSWADFELEWVASADGKVRTYTLTDAAIAAINEAQEVVINGPADLSVVKVYIPSESPVAPSEGEAVTVYIQDYSGKDVADPFETSIIANNDGSYTLANILNSGDPFSFTFPEPEVGDMSGSIEITSPVDADGYYPYLMNADGTDWVYGKAYNFNGVEGWTDLYYVFVAPTYSGVYRYEEGSTYDYYATVCTCAFDSNDNYYDWFYLNFWFNRGTSDGVAEVKTSLDNDAWYTLQGVKIAAPTSKGIYIHNGKKVLVK